MICIYCLQDKPSNEFIKREHVMPQCLGRFTPDNLILNDIVCDSCNQFFGDQLELPLGRDTIWGIERYRHGIKPGVQPKNHKRMKFKISEGELEGIIVLPIYSEQGEHIDNEPVSQVGIFNSLTNKFDYYEPETIPGAEVLRKQGIETKGIKLNLIFKVNTNEKQLLLDKLKQQGYSYTETIIEMEWPEEVKKQNSTWVIAQITLDKIITRALCKIVFNYLALTQGRNFVLSENFNQIRNFIRYDQGNKDDFFFVNQAPILEDDRRFNIRTTRGHLIVLEWNGMSLQARLSLFNMWTHRVRFCVNYNGIWIPINEGHHFDMESRNVDQLVGINKRLL